MAKDTAKSQPGKSKKGHLCAAFAAAALVGGVIFTGATLGLSPQSGPVAEASDIVSVFGQSAARAPQSTDPELGNWDAMLQYQNEAMKDPAKVHAYHDYLRKFEPLKQYPINMQAFFVNDFVLNDITYTSDKEHYNAADYWAAPVETVLSRKGDCEDFAILQKDILHYLGVPESSMFIATVNAVGSTTDGPSHSILMLNEAPAGTPPEFFILNDAWPVIPADNAAVGQAWFEVKGSDKIQDKYVLVDARNDEGFWTTGFRYEAEGVPPPAAKAGARIVARPSGFKPA